MGPSGSGKSTLMHCLAGRDSLTSGQALIGTTDLGELSDAALTRLRRERIGFVFQSFNLIPTLTALENITLPMRLAGRSPESAGPDQAAPTPGLASRWTPPPTASPGGKQYPVATARPLSTR